MDAWIYFWRLKNRVRVADGAAEAAVNLPPSDVAFPYSDLKLSVNSFVAANVEK
jgi:hypothetical protein